MKHYKVAILSRWWLVVIVLDFRFHLRRFMIKKMLDPRLLFLERSRFQDPVFRKPDFLLWSRIYLIWALCLSFSFCIVTISLITRSRIRMLNLKKEIDLYEPHESFFFFSFDNDNHAWLFSLTNSISTTNTINIQIRKLANALFVNDYLTYQYGFATDWMRWSSLFYRILIGEIDDYSLINPIQNLS